MYDQRRGPPPILIVLGVVLLITGAEVGSAAQGTAGPPDCGGQAAEGAARSAARAGAAAAPAPERLSVDSSPVLSPVADVPLGGGTARFDYQSLDDASGLLYLAHMGAGQVIVFDTRSRQVRRVIDGLPGVTGVWVVPELDRLYASATGLHQVVIIDTKSLAVVARVGRIGFPDGIAFAPAAGKVFVSDEAGGGELVIDAARDRAIGTIPLGGEAGNSIYDAGSGCVLVAVQTRNEIVAIDPRSEQVVGRYSVARAKRPHGLSIDASRRLLFVANEGNATLLTLDLRTMQVTQQQPVGSDPDVLAFDPGWRRLYVAAESGRVTVLQEEGDTLVHLGSLAIPDAHSVIVSPGTHLVYFPLRNIRGRAVLRIMTGQRAPGRTP
jgi:DNA-binding beta-propeller fold protein YncE